MNAPAPPLPAPEPEGVIRAYARAGSTPLVIQPAGRRRSWMDYVDAVKGFGGAYSYRCLPLLTGSQQGWELLAPVGFSATWSGGDGLDALSVVFDRAPATPFAASHFGCGLLTIQPGYLFRSPARVNLLFRGPANRPKAGASALEASVEADWNVFNSTFVWRLTVPGLRVRWEEGEPIGLIVPVARGYAETFRPESCAIASAPEIEAAAAAWDAERAADDAARKADPRRPWPGRYLRGEDLAGGAAVEGHRKRVELAPFEARP